MATAARHLLARPLPRASPTLMGRTARGPAGRGGGRGRSSSASGSGGGRGGSSGSGRHKQHPSGRGGPQHGGRGGGRGRGRGASRPQKVPSIVSSNFREQFHAKLCRAARYKVHRPGCACPKVVRLRARCGEGVEQQNEDEGPRSRRMGKGVESNESQSGISAYSDEVQFDVDGTISNQMGRLALSSNDGEGNAKSQATNDPFDNLLVLPDTKGTPAIYTCEGTNLQSFQRDGTACEAKLARAIFGDEGDGTTPSTDKIAGRGGVPPFKVSCALCLLTNHQRNGFVALASESLEGLKPTIDRAREAASVKGEKKQGLHADHAHFVCALKVDSLRSLLAAGKTRSKSRQANSEVLEEIIVVGGVDLPESMSSDPTSVQLAMGHHLTSLLYLLQPPSPKSKITNNSNLTKNDPDQQVLNNCNYIMVLGYIDGPQKLELDLPGGKRHLAESTLDGALREVEEECSLILDRRWLAAQVSIKYGGEATDGGDGADEERMVRVLEPGTVKGSASGDAFFVMTPPPG